MQLALRADSSDFAPDPVRSTSPSRRTKIMVAGIAAASASVIAINPVTSTVPDLAEHAVELAGFTNPLITLQQTLANTFNNLGTLSTASAGATATAAQALSNPAVYAQIANFIAANATNPVPLLTQLANFQATYGAQIGTQTALSQAALQTALNNFPTVLQNTLNFLATGQFVEAFSELNIYTLVQLIERPGNPLVPLFRIPGDIAEALPGGQIVANVIDALLTRGVFSGLTRALLVAPITATLQTAEIFDAIRAAVVAGDLTTAASELINLPIKVANAFINGYVPNFPTRSLFQGVLSPNGPLDYFLVDLPNAIFGALNASVAPTVTVAAAAPTARAAVASAASTDLSLSANTVSLTEGAAAAGAAEAAGAEASTPVQTSTPATGSTTTPSASASAGTVTESVVTQPETAATTAPAATSPASTTSTSTSSPTSGSNLPVSTWGSGSSASGSTTTGSSTAGSTTTGSSTTGSSSTGTSGSTATPASTAATGTAPATTGAATAGSGTTATGSTASTGTGSGSTASSGSSTSGGSTG